MRRTALILVTTLVITILMIMSTGVALASWGWEDGNPATPPTTKVQKPPKSPNVYGHFFGDSTH